MKLVKTASGKQTVKLSKKDWTAIGKKAGWIKSAGLNNQPEYRFYVIVNGKIYSAWEDKEDAIDSREDLGQGKIKAKQTLLREGLDPDNDSNWVSANDPISSGELKAVRLNTVEKVLNASNGTLWEMSPDIAEGYLSSGDLFLILKDEEKFALCSPSNDIYQDALDVPLKGEELKEVQMACQTA